MRNCKNKAETPLEMYLRTVGLVRNDIREPSLIAGSCDLERNAEIVTSKNMISELVVDRNLVGILDGVEDCSHLLVLYWAHRVPDERRSFTKVHPRGKKNLPLVGIFGTCSPVRPNPVLVSVVRLLERKDNILKVESLDAIDGSPIIDIKPHTPSRYSNNEIKLPEWWTS